MVLSLLLLIAFAQVQVHDPLNFPEVNAQGFAVGMNKEVFIAVDATISDRYIFTFKYAFTGPI